MRHRGRVTRHAQVAAGVHCLLARPQHRGTPGTSNARALQDLTSELPAGVSLKQGQVLVVKPGTVVLQAS